MKFRRSVLTILVAMIAVAGAFAPVSAEENMNTTVQAGKVNINRTFQCGETNGNATYQEGRVNINHTVQACRNGGSRGGRSDEMNPNRAGAEQTRVGHGTMAKANR